MYRFCYNPHPLTSSDNSLKKSWPSIRDMLASVVVSMLLPCSMRYTAVRFLLRLRASQLTLLSCLSSSSFMRCPIFIIVFVVSVTVFPFVGKQQKRPVHRLLISSPVNRQVNRNTPTSTSRPRPIRTPTNSSLVLVY